MNDTKYCVKEINYLNSDDNRKMNSICRFWFSEPKTLNLTSPSMTYPFQFKKWAEFYQKNDANVFSYTVQKDEWIIGHGSIKIKKNVGHIFHIIIDSNYRRKGLASKLINELRKKGGDKGVELFTLNVDKKNLAAFYLYEKLGFLKDKSISKNTVRMKTILYA
jgi:ribosomal protein S18 acetylase RimI-like enzyme